MSDVCQLVAGEQTEIGISETIGNRARRFLRLRSQARSTGAIRAVQIDGSVARSRQILTVRNASEMTTSASRPAVDRRGAAHSDLVAQSGVENRALAVNGAEKLLTVNDLCEYLVS